MAGQVTTKGEKRERVTGSKLRKMLNNKKLKIEKCLQKARVLM